jgi:hypothetical protein
LSGSNCIALQLHLCSVSSPPARWGNSALNAALCPRDYFWDPSPALLWEVGLLPHLCSQPMLLYPNLFTESSALCPIPRLLRQAQHSTSTATVHVRLQSAVCVSVLLEGEGSFCPGAVLDYFPMWYGCSPVHSAVSHKQLWNWLGREMVSLFSVWHSIGRLSMG